MSNFDLRKVSIKTDEDAIELLELIVAKAPDFVRLLKKNSLEKQSLLNKVAQAPKQFAPNDNASAAPTASVMDRLSGKTPEAPSSANRIAQLQAAKEENKVQPGEIGNVVKGTPANLENVVTQPAPNAGYNEDGTPILPEDNAEAKVEATTTGGALQPDVTPEAEPTQKAKVPTAEDLTPIGTKVAGKAKSFFNRKK